MPVCDQHSEAFWKCSDLLKAATFGKFQICLIIRFFHNTHSYKINMIWIYNRLKSSVWTFYWQHFFVNLSAWRLCVWMKHWCVGVSYLLWCSGAREALLVLSWSVSVSSKLETFFSLDAFFCEEWGSTRDCSKFFFHFEKTRRWHFKPSWTLLIKCIITDINLILKKSFSHHNKGCK